MPIIKREATEAKGGLSIVPLAATLSEAPKDDAALIALINEEQRQQGLRLQEFMRRTYAYYEPRRGSRGWCGIGGFLDDAGFERSFKGSTIVSDVVLTELVAFAFPREFSTDLSIYNRTGLVRVREALFARSQRQIAKLRDSVVRYASGSNAYIDAEAAARFYTDFGVEPPKSRTHVSASLNVEYSFSEVSDLSKGEIADALKEVLTAGLPEGVSDVHVTGYAATRVETS